MISRRFPKDMPCDDASDSLAKIPNPCDAIGDASDPAGDTLRICLVAMPQIQRRKSLIPVIPLAMPQIQQAIP